MKKVIFICLLSIAVVFSLPETKNEKSATPLSATVENKPAPTQSASAPQAGNQTAAGNESKTITPSANADAPPQQQSDNANEKSPSKEAQDKSSKDGKASSETNASEQKGTNDSANEKKPSNETKPEIKPNNSTNTEGAKTTLPPSVSPDSNQKTPATVPTTPKALPANASTVSPVKPSDSTTAATVTRSFDSASFIGGIILTLGLLAIGFMGFKYYKAQTERNYHTL